MMSSRRRTFDCRPLPLPLPLPVALAFAFTFALAVSTSVGATGWPNSTANVTANRNATANVNATANGNATANVKSTANVNATATGTGTVPWPINFYELFYEYVRAVSINGIPSLNVPPLDPLRLPLEIVFTDHHNRNYPNYTGIVVNTSGLIVYDFSKFVVDLADLDLRQLYANLRLSIKRLPFALTDVRATVVDIDGRVLAANCTDMQLEVINNLYRSVKELELDGSSRRLRVKRFQLVYHSPMIIGQVTPDKCSGDIDVVYYMHSAVFDPVANWVLYKLPAELEAWSDRVTTVLDAVFGLRNVTVTVDDDAAASVSSRPARSTATQLEPAPEPEMELETEPNEEGGGGGGGGSRLIMRAAHSSDKQESKTNKSNNNNKMQIKWPNLFY